MTPEQLTELRHILAACRIPDDKLSEDRPFLRGWNEGVAFAENKIALILSKGFSPSTAGE